MSFSWGRWVRSRWNQDRLVFAMAMMVIMGASIFKPGLPLVITPMVKTIYHTLDEVPEDTVFILALSAPFHYMYDCTVGDIAIIKHMTNLCRDRGCKIVMTAMGPDQRIINLEILDTLEKTGYLEGLTYGEDYIDLGFIPGQEIAVGAMVEDLHAIAPTDKDGIPIENFPMMENIRDMDDYGLMYFSITSIIDRFPRQWGEPALARGIPIIGTTLSASYTFGMPWIEQGYIIGLLNSGRGAAEYEQYASLQQNDKGFMGTASTLMDVYSSIHLFAVLVIISGFIFSVYSLTKRPEEVIT
jgi:hypothetical protein